MINDDDDSELLAWNEFKHVPGIYQYKNDSGTYVVVGKGAGAEVTNGGDAKDANNNGYMWLIVDHKTGKLSRCEALFDGHMGPMNKAWRKIENVELRLVLKVD